MPYENKINEIDKLKSQINNFRPLNQHSLKQIKEYYRIGLTFSSNAIEGNTLTETETKIVLEDGLTIAGKPLRDHYEVSGHSEAFDLIYELSKKKSFTEKNILNIHKLFYYRIDKNNAGQYRKIPIIITGTDYIPPSPSKIATLMKKFISEVPILIKKHHPIEFAAITHMKLADIHPFVDGNGRTARLLMNLSLIQNGYAITIIPPLLRRDYISCIKKSQTGEKDAGDFINFISERVYQGMKEYLRLLKQCNV